MVPEARSALPVADRPGGCLQGPFEAVTLDGERVVAQPGGFLRRMDHWGMLSGRSRANLPPGVGEGGRSPGSTSRGNVAVVDMREELARNTADIEQSGEHW